MLNKPAKTNFYSIEYTPEEKSSKLGLFSAARVVVWETVAPAASPARLHSNALDTFRSSCSHH